MKNIQNQTKVDTNFSINNDTYEKDEKHGEIELTNNKIINCETKYNYDHDEDEDDEDDELSEFTQYRDHDFESDDDLESSLDFDIIYKPTNNIELIQMIEIKSKIVNRIKLNTFDLLYIKKLNDNDKFDLLKLFNHMV